MYGLTDADYLAAWKKLSESGRNQECFACGGAPNHVALTRGQVASMGGEDYIREVAGDTYCIIKDQR